jgi:hypothetical protein
MDNIESSHKKLLAITSPYQQWPDSLDARVVQDMHSLATSFEADAKNAADTLRLLRIGIIGQIKRGKSSFLNSLLFDSRDILPKAATPMTAALTRITYAPTPSAKVEFYTEQEWRKVVQSGSKVQQEKAAYDEAMQSYHAERNKNKGAKLPQMPRHSDEEKACAELLQMVERSGLDIGSYLGTSKSLDGVSSNEELVNRLGEYVGASGRFTPIVKSTELCLALESLHDIEIVDTPGMNDPIISRGRRTQDFMGQCDVIFLLSYCGQFLDSHDMGLLAQNIPAKGIRDIVLVGSMFDSALQDEYHKYSSLQEALPDLTEKLNSQAESNVSQVCNRARQQAMDSGVDAKSSDDSVLQALQKALPPIFISSRWLDLGRKAGVGLSHEEQHSLDALNKMFSGFTFTPPILLQLANFGPVQEKLEEVRNNKDAILANRYNELLSGATRGLLSLLDKLAADVKHRKQQLEQGDLVAIANQQKEIQANIKAGKNKVSAIFEKYSVQVERKMADVAQELQQRATSAKRVSSKTDSKQESYETSRSVSNSTWYKPWTWGDTKTVYETHYRTVSYTYANVHDAISQLEDFISDASRFIYESSKSAINLDLFRKDVKDAVKGMFDFSDPGFDPDMVLLPLGNAVERITIPLIELDLDHHIGTIRSQFDAGEVQGSDIDRLRNEQARVVQQVLADVVKEVRKLDSAATAKLKKEEEAFIPELSRDLVERVEQLKRDLKNREQSLATYQQILEKIEKDKITLQR